VLSQLNAKVSPSHLFQTFNVGSSFIVKRLLKDYLVPGFLVDVNASVYTAVLAQYIWPRTTARGYN